MGAVTITARPTAPHTALRLISHPHTNTQQLSPRDSRVSGPLCVVHKKTHDRERSSRLHNPPLRAVRGLHRPGSPAPGRGTVNRACGDPVQLGAAGCVGGLSARDHGSSCAPRIELSLIHISEPTRRTPISYAVFCLK